ncbi:hypothetical protein [Chitinolyticbacter meiyuanensis]|uniref:hypothetical protein n=1 Tax=Chitinolyticbacter meiyuanensis TaxID=682798 RepID=UPI0011E59C17|nr:hypothetical protein [Chitinolyticbacter meiyuanensis]
MRIEIEEHGERFAFEVVANPGHEQQLADDPPQDRASIDAGEVYGWWEVTRGQAPTGKAEYEPQG